MFFGIVAVAGKFVPLFFTDRFHAVTPLMMIEAIVIVLIAWSNAIGTQYLLPTKQTKSYTTSVVLGAVVNIFINIPLILAWGAIGAAVATVLSEITVTSYQLWTIRRQISYRGLFNDNQKYMVAGVAMFIVVRLFDKLLAANWLMLSFEIVVGIGIYGLFLIILRASIIKDAVQLIKYKNR